MTSRSVERAIMANLGALTEDATAETSPDAVTRDATFYSDHVVFQVEKRLFRVPRRKFEQESEVFRDMFALPASKDSTEGTSDEHPLVLESIVASEFRALLRVMFRPYYGPSYEERQKLSLDEWISVLKLATMWHFTTLRDIAKKHLTALLQEDDPVRWISLARTYNVHEWLMPALSALARRVQPLRLCEVESLGIETVIKMAEVRELAARASARSIATGGHYGWVRNREDIDAQIKLVFEDELGRLAGQPPVRWEVPGCGSSEDKDSQLCIH